MISTVNIHSGKFYAWLCPFAPKIDHYNYWRFAFLIWYRIFHMTISSMCEVWVVIIIFFIWCRMSLLTTHSDFLFIVDLARKTELQVVNKNNSYLQGEPARFTELGTETNLEALTLFVRLPTAVSLGGRRPYKKG